jgi:hypothetical protein
MTLITSAHEPNQWPIGRIPGCLPRKWKLGAKFPLARERIKIIPRADWPALAKQQRMRQYIPTVLDQDGVGSCATESTTGGVMTIRAYRGLPFVLLNPWFIYHTTSGGRDAGSSIDENLDFVREHGIAPESVWPRSKGWRAKPSAEAYEAAKPFRIREAFDISTVDEAVSALFDDYCIVYGAKGHSVLKVEYDKDLNSWGRDWGNDGIGLWASVNAINWNYGAFAIRNTVEG